MPDVARTRRLLNVIAVVALLDFLLLIPLVLGAVGAIDSDSFVGILGPIHGVGYLALLYLTAKGAGERRWGWWFPAITLVTAGPPGSLIGDVLLRRQLDAAPADA
ncbi:hypothetical protein PAI11_04890 [Patulibacter medicamentivorans]|uniref:DUF3817 domain-containing protein n=1 Tax=Patulibacter medicamentivorans TaxID=1097667 RepID=H0E130_9ACTN|nr:DUF3817 domain-containing protein [Patulibacter medicamentivorans]EHN12605.1 hypothetical protein PAI11_04890 [Patulibacter medicamentivorans]